VKKERNTVEDWFNSAITSFGSGRYKQALAAHEQVKRLEPGGLHDLILTGLQQVAANHFEEALDTYEEALSLDPGAAFVHTQKGIALMCLGRCQEALAAHEEALRLEPGHPLATMQRAMVLLLLERYEEALAISEQAFADNAHPINPLYALMNKAGALSGLERYDEAIEVARQMMRLAPRQVVGHAALGDILEQLGRDSEALSAYEQGLRRDTRQAGLWAHMAGVLLRLGYTEDALFAFEQAERLGCQEASCYRGKGDALMERMRYRQAIDAYEQALLLEPGDQESQRKRMEALGRALPEEAASEAARPLHGGSAIGLVQARLPDIGARLRSLGWMGAIAVVVSITLVLTYHLDVRPLFKALLSVALLPLELLAILLYPLSCALGWGRRRRIGFHPRIVRVRRPDALPCPRSSAATPGGGLGPIRSGRGSCARTSLVWATSSSPRLRFLCAPSTDSPPRNPTH
jgi:tetratricopeptide (TPR) repeat protein